jgi:hypothetical protein
VAGTAVAVTLYIGAAAAVRHGGKAYRRGRGGRTSNRRGAGRKVPRGPHSAPDRWRGPYRCGP